MKALLPLLLVSAAAHAERTWVVEPGQSLVTVEGGPARARIAATSLGMTGKLRELDSGLVQAEVRIALASLATGSRTRDQKLQQDAEASQFPEAVLSATSAAPDHDGNLRLKGTLTLHGASRPLEVPATLVRAGGMMFGHLSLVVHLRDFGIVAPQDEVRVEMDAGMHLDAPVATRG